MMKKRICIISDSFVPAKISAAGMLYNLSMEMVNNNHHIICIYGDSSLNNLNLQNKNYINYNLSKFEIIKTSVLSTFRNKTYFHRFIYELTLSLVLSYKIFLNYKKLNKIDLILWYSPSAFLWLPSLILKLVCKAPLYLIVRDIFPDWLISIKVINNIFIRYILKFLTLPQFYIPNKIGAQSKSDCKYLIKKTGRNDIDYLPNWPSLIKTKNESLDRNKLSIKFNNHIRNKKKLNHIFGVYSGNTSIAHDYKTSMDFLIEFSKSVFISKTFEINLFGVDKYSYTSSFKNKKFNYNQWGYIEPNYLPYIFSKSNFGLVSLNRLHLTNNIPGKFVSYTQFGLPILCFCSKNSDLARLINHFNCGVVIDLDDRNKSNFKKLGEFILLINNNNNIYSQNSLRLFNDNFSVKYLSKNILKNFNL